MRGGTIAMRGTGFNPLDRRSLRAWQPDVGGDNREQIQRLLANLPLAVEQELTPRQRQILLMRFDRGMRVTDIAAELGLTKSAVSRSLSRSTERLFKALRYSL